MPAVPSIIIQITCFQGEHERNECKGKVRPRIGHEGPEGQYRYSSTLSLTSALDGVAGQRHAPTALPPGKRRGSHCIGGLNMRGLRGFILFQDSSRTALQTRSDFVITRQRTYNGNIDTRSRDHTCGEKTNKYYIY